MADRAKKYGVNRSAIFYALKRMKITRKKQLRYREINRKEKKLMAPIIFKVSLNTVGFEQWLNQNLLPSLKIPSALIMDNYKFIEKTLLNN